MTPRRETHLREFEIPFLLATYDQWRSKTVRKDYSRAWRGWIIVHKRKSSFLLESTPTDSHRYSKGFAKICIWNLMQSNNDISSLEAHGDTAVVETTDTQVPTIFLIQRTMQNWISSYALTGIGPVIVYNVFTKLCLGLTKFTSKTNQMTKLSDPTASS